MPKLFRPRTRAARKGHEGWPPARDGRQCEALLLKTQVAQQPTSDEVAHVTRGDDERDRRLNARETFHHRQETDGDKPESEEVGGGGAVHVFDHEAQKRRGEVEAEEHIEKPEMKVHRPLDQLSHEVRKVEWLAVPAILEGQIKNRPAQERDQDPGGSLSEEDAEALLPSRVQQEHAAEHEEEGNTEAGEGSLEVSGPPSR